MSLIIGSYKVYRNDDVMVHSIKDKVGYFGIVVKIINYGIVVKGKNFFFYWINYLKVDKNDNIFVMKVKVYNVVKPNNIDINKVQVIEKIYIRVLKIVFSDMVDNIGSFINLNVFMVNKEREGRMWGIDINKVKKVDSKKDVFIHVLWIWG